MMPNSIVFNRTRSQFYLRVNGNDDGGYNLYASDLAKSLIDHFHHDFIDVSPRDWEKCRTGDLKGLWIPPDKAHRVDIESIKSWATFAGKRCIWLGLGKNLVDHFTGDEMECCVAADFNSVVDDEGNLSRDPAGKPIRSELGEAEYQLKYRVQDLDAEGKARFCAKMSQATLGAFDLLPLRKPSSPFTFSLAPQLPAVVSPIPAQEGVVKLAWALAKHVATQRGLAFIEPRLQVLKPQMKQLTIAQKVSAWTGILQTPGAVALDFAAVNGHDVVVVDDLYQSGITMWAYARYLKQIGARRVFGLVCVKSMKDSDNQ